MLKPLSRSSSYRSRAASFFPILNLAKAQHNCGQRLRSLRLALGLSLRDVHRESLMLGAKLRNPEFIVSTRALHTFETKNAVPRIHKLYTLARIYQCGFAELLGWYGIPRR